MTKYIEVANVALKYYVLFPNVCLCTLISSYNIATHKIQYVHHKIYTSQNGNIYNNITCHYFNSQYEKRCNFTWESKVYNVKDVKTDANRLELDCDS